VLNSSPILQTTNLTKSFGGRQSLADVSFHVHPQECLGIIGPNGAGKTTLFNLLTGFYTPTTGTIFWQQNPIQSRSPAAIARLGIARTFQNIRLFKQLSVLENVRIAYDSHLNYTPFGALLRTPFARHQEKGSSKKALELLDMLGMADLREQPAGSLPYGFQRRLEIARALALNPKLLLLDEPVAGMNEHEMEKILELLRWVHREFSSTFILIEHHMDFIMELCPRLLVLDFGSLIAEGSPSEIKKNQRVIEAYLGTET